MADNSVFLGVDGGGTKTKVTCINHEGKALGEVTTGCTNWNSVGDDAAFSNLKEGIEKSLEAAGSTTSQVVNICLGMAGVDRPEDQVKLDKIVREILPQVKQVKIVNDGEVALASGTNGVLEGICVISGTGTIVIGYHNNVSLRSAGWGPLLGDKGSGFYIAMEALTAVTRAHDDGSNTLLTQLILDTLGLQKPTELIGWAYKDTEWARFAALSKCVFEAYEKEDKKAIEIVQEAANRLVFNIQVVYERGGFKDVSSVDVVFAGGNLTHNDGKGVLASNLKSKLESQFSNVKIQLPVVDPSLAAALMATKLN